MMSGFFGLVTFVSPWLTMVAGVPSSIVPWALLMFGMASVISILVGGRLNDSYPNQTLLFSFVFWTFAFALPCSRREPDDRGGRDLHHRAHQHQQRGTANAHPPRGSGGARPRLTLISSVYNTGIAIGAYIAAFALERGMGYAQIPWFGVVFSIAAGIVCALTLAAERHRRPQWECEMLSDVDRLKLLRRARQAARRARYRHLQRDRRPVRAGTGGALARSHRRSRRSMPRRSTTSARRSGHGMELSYGEILELLKRLDMSPDGLRPSRRHRLRRPRARSRASAPAVDDLIARARSATPDNPLYVIAIAAISNIASALLKAPDIIDRIVVVWLGGHALEWPHQREFNLMQDVGGAQVLFDSGAAAGAIALHGRRLAPAQHRARDRALRRALWRDRQIPRRCGSRNTKPTTRAGRR